MKNFELATFGGGCFWCTQAIFEQIDGVNKVVSGYAGGKTENPTYEQVCSGATEHAEVIQVEYNPEKVKYVELLEVFFKTHDPTTLNQQGVDKGTQYRSIILYHTPQQKEQASYIINSLTEAEIWNDKIVTELTKYETFYSAESYHQQYFKNNPNQMYCQITIVPKLKKLEKLFKDKLNTFQ